MKKLLALVAILGMVTISTNTQATSGCYGGGGGGTCVVNTTASSSTYEADSYYGNPYQPVTASMHVVSFGEGGGGIGTVSTETGSCSLDFQANSGGDYRVPSYNPCPTLYTGDYGWIYITAQAYNNAGYVYANAVW